MKHFAICFTLVVSGTMSVIAADETTVPVPPAAEVTQPAPVQPPAFNQKLDQFRNMLVEFEYGSRRWSAYFTPLEYSVMQGLQHVMQLADKVKGFSQDSIEGREAFRQLSVPLQHVSMNVRQSPVLRHVAHQWDDALLVYQDLVRLFTGTNVSPTPGYDLNHPKLVELKNHTRELRDLVQHFEHQVKSGLPMVNIEAQGLVAYVSHFAVYTNKLHTHSLSFVTERFQMAETLRKSIEVSKQISAVLLYHPMPYLRESWDFIRVKANLMRESFEGLMQNPPVNQPATQN